MNLIFTYSNIYEQRLNSGEKTLDVKLALSKVEMLTAFWKKESKNIEDALKAVTGLSFADETVKCYLNSVTTFSDPLSIQIEEDADMKDNLIHELIHVLLSQNNFHTKESWKQLDVDFSTQTFSTRIHVPIHAIHLLICEKIMPDRKEHIRSYSTQSDYVTSWKIVDEIGAEEIVRKYIG